MRSAQLRRAALGARHPLLAGPWRPGCSRKTSLSCVIGLLWGIDLSRHGRTGKLTRQSKEAVIGRRIIRDPLIHAQNDCGIARVPGVERCVLGIAQIREELL